VLLWRNEGRAEVCVCGGGGESGCNQAGAKKGGRCCWCTYQQQQGGPASAGVHLAGRLGSKDGEDVLLTSHPEVLQPVTCP
jgi:hypothetical protein